MANGYRIKGKETIRNMQTTYQGKKGILLLLMWFIEGVVVGFGAILPGVSGGTLCVAFGMYRPIIETLSNVFTGLKKYWLMLGVFFAGILAGFVGLSGIAAWLMEENTVLITCVFVGFILGTIPELWQDAGEEGRSKASFLAMAAGFVIMLLVLSEFKTELAMNIVPDFKGYLLCGLLWGLSFVVPGLSSSSLLLFFGLYQPMLEGISTLNFSVLIPMGIGMLACVLILSKAVGYAYKKHYSVISHTVLGIVAATTVMIIPRYQASVSEILMNIVSVGIGAMVSYEFTVACKKLRENFSEEK